MTPVFMFQLGGLYTRLGQRIVAVDLGDVESIPGQSGRGYVPETHLVQFVDLDRGIDGVVPCMAHPKHGLTQQEVQEAVTDGYLRGGCEYWRDSQREVARKLEQLGGIEL